MFVISYGFLSHLKVANTEAKGHNLIPSIFEFYLHPTRMAEKPFKIAVSDNQLNLLSKKLDITRFPDELEAVGRDYGAPLTDVRRLVEYWIQGFDWRLHEAKLNEELPQFTRDIDIDEHGTLNIHYVHKKSKSPDAIPLVFVHGCKYRLYFAVTQVC